MFYPIPDSNVSHALFAGVYLQDEWKILPEVTINYGARFDEYYSTFDKENQPSPRVNVIYQPTDSTTLHAGYARYFTPPPLENVSASSVALFTAMPNSNTRRGHTGRRGEGGTGELFRRWHFAKSHRSTCRSVWTATTKMLGNQLDDGLFGQSLILSAFNYAKGRVYGVEFTGSYNNGGFSSYANLAWSVAQGKDWNSAQFQFGQNDLNYVQNHWIYLDHDQRITGSFGVAYTWNESARCSTRVYADALYGSGLRADGGGTEDGTPAGDPIPNGASVPQYYSVNLGAEQSFKLARNRMLKARLDVVNVTDSIYDLRDGSGVGVNAAQYGERLGFFGSLSYMF